MGREELFERLEGGGMLHAGLFAPLEEELAPYAPGFGWLEAGGTRRDEDGIRLEGQGTRREEVFAGYEVPF